MEIDLLAACEKASQVLSDSCQRKQILAGSLFAEQSGTRFTANYGLAANDHASYLLGSITKPIAICALMGLYDQKAFELNDPLARYLPKFTQSEYPRVTIKHLLTHTSGLPDQVPDNHQLRSGLSPLSAFVESCERLPFRFAPGTNYEYSSMGILLACSVAEKIASMPIAELVQERVLSPLAMSDSALGIGKLSASQRMPVQTEFGAPEAGGGAVDAARWDWNSVYWRGLGAPWGGGHASASDVGKFLSAMISDQDDFLKASTKRLMLTNHNANGLESRGLGFDVDMRSSKVSCSANSFGHSGSTGTLAWVDRDMSRICVVLTTLPARALDESVHPRHLASEWIAKA
jgi:CubicO group peptidase (beta-lactamase class C family)